MLFFWSLFLKWYIFLWWSAKFPPPFGKGSLYKSILNSKGDNGYVTAQLTLQKGDYPKWTDRISSALRRTWVLSAERDIRPWEMWRSRNSPLLAWGPKGNYGNRPRSLKQRSLGRERGCSLALYLVLWPPLCSFRRAVSEGDALAIQA